MRRMSTLASGLFVKFRSALVNDFSFLPLPKIGMPFDYNKLYACLSNVIFSCWFVFNCRKNFHQEFYNIGGLSLLHCLECDLHTTLLHCLVRYGTRDVC
jgi:hypothetical protein